MTRLPLAAVLWLAAAAPALAQGDAEAQRKVHEKALRSVTGIRAKAPLGERSGTGIVLTADGLILTSYAVVPEGSTNIRVWLNGPRLLQAEIVATARDSELTLLRVKPKGELSPIELGDSDGVKVGDAVYTFGNASNSIIDNDAASLAAGVVSARYRLDQPRANSTYVGPVIESTAAVNPKIEGGPLLDGAGRMVGFVTLNYSPHRFLGAAIPVNLLKPVIDRLKAGPAVDPGEKPGEEVEGWIGLKVADKDGAAVVDSVEPSSPAAEAGLASGMKVLAVGGAAVKDAAAYLAAVKDLKSGSTLFLKVDDRGDAQVLKIPVGRKK